MLSVYWHATLFHLKRNKDVLQLADDSTGVFQRWVCWRLRYSSSDASEWRPGRGTSEAGNQISSPGSRKTVLVSKVASLGWLSIDVNFPKVDLWRVIWPAEVQTEGYDVKPPKSWKITVKHLTENNRIIHNDYISIAVCLSLFQIL